MLRKSRDEIIESLQIGNIIAFTLDENMYSGKVEAIEGDKITVKTKNCSVFFITKNQVVWVKNGTFWPQGVYNALKLTNK